MDCDEDEPGQRALANPLVIVEILSPSNETETRRNVWAYPSLPSVRHVLLVRSTDIGAELLSRQEDGSWPDVPIILGPSDRIPLDGIDYDAALIGFYAGTHLSRG